MMGDVIFLAEGRPFVTFTQISDPERLASVVKTLKQQQAAMQIGGRIEMQSQALPKSGSQHMQKVQPDGIATNVSCTMCGKNDNPVGSKFCNKCGSQLSF
jgi:hypothetical protein